LTIAKRDIADLAFSGLLAHVREKLERRGFSYVNHVLQQALTLENRPKDIQEYG
jgi:hypothetical protein